MGDNLFDAVHRSFQQHVAAEPHHHVACALWALHTHVYQKFEYTPRLSLQSPTPESGKSEVLKLLSLLTPSPELLVDPTAATLFRLASGDNTLLLDEIDNLRIERSTLAILNKGHEKGGTVPRTIKGEVVKWPVFAPVAFAGIGTLPPTLTSRSIVIQMYRAEPGAVTRLDLNNTSQMQELASCHAEAIAWAAKVNLNTDPTMPAGFSGRNANKWRAPFAIADSLGRGDIARKAAAKFDHDTAHVNELLLRDKYKIFERKGTKGLPSFVLVEELLGLEDGEHDYNEFKGIHALTQGSLAQVMKAFGIKPVSIWWPEGAPRSQQSSCKGYLRADLEVMWRRYGIGGTTAQRHNPSSRISTKKK
jgi:hypothetical protein